MTAKAITVTSLAADTMQKVIGATVAKADLTTKEFGVTQVKEDTTVWAYIDHRVKGIFRDGFEGWSVICT